MFRPGSFHKNVYSRESILLIDCTSSRLPNVRNQYSCPTHNPIKCRQRPSKSNLSHAIQWHRSTQIARRVGAVDGSPPYQRSRRKSLAEDGSEKLIPNDREKQREKRAHAIEAGKRIVKMLDLQYFVEMVDQECRYSSSCDSTMPIGKNGHFTKLLSLVRPSGWERCRATRVQQACLDKKCVSYLPREERLSYTVTR